MSNWLEQVIDQSVAGRQCTRMYCTTCGAFHFRTQVVLSAMAEAGVDSTATSGVDLREIMSALSREDREAVFDAIASALRDVD